MSYREFHLDSVRDKLDSAIHEARSIDDDYISGYLEDAKWHLREFTRRVAESFDLLSRAPAGVDLRPVLDHIAAAAAGNKLSELDLAIIEAPTFIHK